MHEGGNPGFIACYNAWPGNEMDLSVDPKPKLEEILATMYRVGND